MTHQIKDRRITVGLCLALVLMVWFVFGQTLTFDFVNCDDNVFVYENPIVLNGVTWNGVVRALTQMGDTFYYPLAVLSFMVESELYGMNPAGFHATNIVLHSLSVVLLFFLLQRMTGSLWGSAFLAAVFAIHPIQVEAVAWVAGRKDMLSGVFFLLTLHAYLRYVGKVEGRENGELSADGRRWESLPQRTLRNTEASTPSLCVPLYPPAKWVVKRCFEGGNRKSAILSYGLVFVLFAAGLMAKPMLVTLPCILLLLDYWPLGRFGEERELATKSTKGHEEEESLTTNNQQGETSLPQQPTTINQQQFLLLEKLPFFLLSAVFCVIPFFASGRLSGGSPVQQPEWSWRIGNAFVSYAAYLRQMIWPAGLAMPYPKTPHADLWVILSAILLLGITAFVIRSSRKPSPTNNHSPITNNPALAVGWFWFVGMLFPVSGVLRFLGVARADRFVYLPMIGILILIGGIFKGKRLRWPLALFVIFFLAALSFVQTGYWRNNLTLWTRSLESTDGSAMAYINLGAVLYEEGERAAAEACFFQALEVDPKDQQALYNLGVVLLDRGKSKEGMARLREVLALNPDRFDANKALGAVLLLQGKFEAGIEHTRRALRVRPESVGAQRNLEAGERLHQKHFSRGAEDL